jgi:hypothetical protein
VLKTEQNSAPTIVLKGKGKTGTGLYMLQNMPKGILPLRNDVGLHYSVEEIVWGISKNETHTHLQAFCILKWLASVFFFPVASITGKNEKNNC